MFRRLPVLAAFIFVLYYLTQKRGDPSLPTTERSTKHSGDEQTLHTASTRRLRVGDRDRGKTIRPAERAKTKRPPRVAIRIFCDCRI